MHCFTWNIPAYAPLSPHIPVFSDLRPTICIQVCIIAYRWDEPGTVPTTVHAFRLDSLHQRYIPSFPKEPPYFPILMFHVKPFRGYTYKETSSLSCWFCNSCIALLLNSVLVGFFPTYFQKNPKRSKTDSQSVIWRFFLYVSMQRNRFAWGFENISPQKKTAPVVGAAF